MTTTLAPVTNFDVTTSWIPLVTPWPLTEACSSQIYSAKNFAMVAFDPIYYSSMNTSAATCLPPEITSWWFQTRRALFTTSLGPLACPAAYSTGSASIVNAYTAEVFCCPSGYDFITSCNWATLGQCVSTMTPGQVLSYIYEDDSSSWVGATTTIQSQVVTVYAAHVNGFAVSTSTVPTSTVSTSAVPSPTARTSKTTASGAATNTSKSGISPGANIGIGIGVGIAIIGLLVAVGALFFYRRRQKPAKLPIKFPGYVPQQQLAELDGPYFELSGSRNSRFANRDAQEMGAENAGTYDRNSW